MRNLLIPLCILPLLAACSSGSGDDFDDIAVSGLAGPADYTGTFSARTEPENSSVNVNGARYNAGQFTGSVTAQADFDADQIDVQLTGDRTAGVIDIYSARYDNVRIRGNEFEGTGSESLVIGDYSHRDAPSEIDGTISADGERISGDFDTEFDRDIEVEGDFSATRD
jgi:hypothetical protein